MTSIKPTIQTYEELQEAYDFLNERLFKGELPQCIITLQREKKTCGYYARDRFVDKDCSPVDEIALNPQHFDLDDIPAILTTLGHQMVHQWQSHFGKWSRSGYHNKQWAAKMEEIGLVPSSTGEENGARTGFKMSAYPDPNGKFTKVVTDLLTTEFTVSWRDRFVEIDDEEIGSEEPVKTPVYKSQKNVRDLLDGKTKSKKQTRIKYSHVCEDGNTVNVWGAKDLSLTCGICQKPLEPLN